MKFHADEFMWAVGIEDTFIPQVATRTGRMLDEYELTQHYRFWKEDLGLVTALGVRHLRYGIPWYRVNPAPGRFDWSWTDQVLDYMVNRLGIQPIVDLMHYGCPLWMEREFINPDYPKYNAEYSAAFVERYKGLTRYYTPLNEPQVNIKYSGLNGYWPPYLRGWRGYVRMMMAIALGMSRTTAAIREMQPDASIFHVEAVTHYTSDDPALQELVEFTRQRRFLSTDLLLGWVNDDHPMTPWLLQHGASEADLEWLRAHPQDIDIMGCNFYPGWSPHRLRRKDGKVLDTSFWGHVPSLEFALRAHQGRYRKPVMITETSTPGVVVRRERWLDDSVALVQQLREQGFPIIGYTWFPLFSLVKWEYRLGRKLLGAYLAHMGLWDLQDDGSGTLLRRPTRLVQKYAGYVAGTRAARGETARDSSAPAA